MLHSLGKTIFSNFLDVFGFDSITFNPDGKILAANDSQDIKLWDVESGKEIAKLSGHFDKVTCVAFNPTNGRIIASCSYDKTFSPVEKIIASGGEDNTIRIWSYQTAERYRLLSI